MTLRWATAEDAGLLASAHALAFDPPWSPKAFAELFASPGVHGLLIEGANGPLGLALCRTIAGETEILTIGVAPAARRTGAGRLLMSTALDAARSQGAEACFLEVAADNAAAIGLYQALGFEQAGLRRGYYDRGPAGAADAFVMRLDLRAEAP